MSFAFQEAVRFPPGTVAMRIAIALAVGMLVGFERESADKDAGIRTNGLTAVLGALSVVISLAYGLAAMVGVIVLIVFLNARSMISMAVSGPTLSLSGPIARFGRFSDGSGRIPRARLGHLPVREERQGPDLG
jgi:hypothetical protein